jgi:UDP-4-amino-4,6-dideoxy-N-acetyl-beta-L-altrosamine N-acetyltransferase
MKGETALRKVRLEDKDQLLRWRNLPEVAQYMYTDHLITSEEHERWFHRMLQDPTCQYWIIASDGQDVGVAYLYNISLQHSRCYWGFYLASPSARGKGVGSFVECFILRHVFEELKLSKLCCEVLASNPAVIKMHQSFGFKQEGFFREHIIKQAIPEDVVSLATLRREWETLKPKSERRCQFMEKGG